MISKKEESELRKMTREILHEELRKRLDETRKMIDKMSKKLDEIDQRGEWSPEDLRKIEA